VQIVFAPGTVANDFSVQIVSPQNIVDNYGNLPSNLASNLKSDLNSIYNSNLNSASNNFPNYFMFLSIICVISFIFDIEFMRFLQIIYIHYFVIMALPPELTKVFNSLRYSTIFYLPDVYTLTDPVLRPAVPSNVYNSIGDYSFLRNAGFAFTPFIVILFIWMLLKLLSVPEINRFKNFRVWCYNLLESKFKFSIQLQWTSIFFQNTVFFAFLQMRDYNIYDTETQISIILAHVIIVLLTLVSIFVAYRVISFYR